MAALPLHRQSPAATTRRRVDDRPQLALAPRRRRWPALLLGAALSAVFAGMLAAAVFHTQLAERQLRIDRLERAVVAERERFDELRYERAELRSPVRLAREAGALGMLRGQTNDFVRIEPERLARQIAAAGAADDDAARIIVDADPLDQFRDVKAVSEGQP